MSDICGVDITRFFFECVYGYARVGDSVLPLLLDHVNLIQDMGKLMIEMYQIMLLSACIRNTILVLAKLE